MTRVTRLSAAIAALTVCGVLAIGAASVGAKTTSKGRRDSGVVHFALTYTAGGKDYSAGNSQDKLFGTGAVTYVIKILPTTTSALEITAKPVTLYFKNGTLTGTATALLTPGANGAATISGGKLTASHGTAGQAGHSVTLTFQGSGSTTTGSYTITYTGFYK